MDNIDDWIKQRKVGEEGRVMDVKEAFTSDWRPRAAAGPRPAGPDWRPEPLHRCGCGGGPRGCGSCGARCSRRRNSIPSWPRSCRRGPCRRNPCTCTTSSRYLEMRAESEEGTRDAGRRSRFESLWSDWRLSANLVWLLWTRWTASHTLTLLSLTHTHTYGHTEVCGYLKTTGMTSRNLKWREAGFIIAHTHTHTSAHT